MADEVEDVGEVEGGEEGKKGGPPVMIIAAVAVVLIGGAAAFFLLSGGDAEAKPKEKAEVGKILPVDSFIVNLNEAKSTRYLKLTIAVELGDDSLEELVTKRIDIVRDRVLTYLAGLTIDDVRGSETKEIIRERIIEQANEALGEEDAIKQVLFKEFVVQ